MTFKYSQTKVEILLCCVYCEEGTEGGYKSHFPAHCLSKYQSIGSEILGKSRLKHTLRAVMIVLLKLSLPMFLFLPFLITNTVEFHLFICSFVRIRNF